MRSSVGKFSPQVRARRVKRDVETRERLLESALLLFAERGFHHVTVRQISQRARVNLAAISYHFGDKLGLYSEIFEGAIAGMRALNDACIEAAKTLSAEDKIRHFVRTYLPLGARPDGRTALLQQLMRHEMQEPTAVLGRVVERGILPRLQYLSGAVAEMLDCAPEDERVRMCVLSIQGQFLFFIRNKFHSQFYAGWLPAADEDLARTTEHVAEFSLAGIRALATRQGARRRDP